MIIKINEGTPQERIIGELFVDKGVFFKQVSKKKHLFRKLDAWGIDAEYFENVLLPNNYFIQILDKDENKYYGIEAQEFKKNRKFFHFKNPGEDHRAQAFLPLRFWKIIK
jgi:hypothetical protein